MGLIREPQWTNPYYVPIKTHMSCDTPCLIKRAIMAGTLASVLRDKTILPLPITKDDPNPVVLFAVAKDKPQELRLLLEDGRFDPNSYSWNGEQCPITYAATKSAEMVRILAADPGVHIHALNGFGQSAITTAATKGQTDIVNFLLEDGRIDPWHLDNRGYTALHGAVLTGHTKTAELLLFPPNTRYSHNPNKERTYKRHKRDVFAN